MLIGARFHQLRELHPSLGPECQQVSQQHHKDMLSAESTGLPGLPAKSHTGRGGEAKATESDHLKALEAGGPEEVSRAGFPLTPRGGCLLTAARLQVPVARLTLASLPAAAPLLSPPVTAGDVVAAPCESGLWHCPPFLSRHQSYGFKGPTRLLYDLILT